jgi:hypothetical protein
MVIGFDPVRVLSRIARRLTLARDLKFLVNYVVGAHRIGGHEQNENVAGPKVGLDLIVPVPPRFTAGRRNFITKVSGRAARSGGSCSL